jgi:Protein of unknown function (DUF2934)
LAWVLLGPGPNTGVGIEGRPALPDPPASRPSTDPPSPAKAADDSQEKAREESPEFTRLVELRAYTLWDRGGRPVGPAGEAIKEKNWIEAERQLRDEVLARAYHIWERQGRPTGAAGASVKDKNLRSAEVELLEETEAELQRHPIH